MTCAFIKFIQLRFVLQTAELRSRSLRSTLDSRSIVSSSSLSLSLLLTILLRCLRIRIVVRTRSAAAVRPIPVAAAGERFPVMSENTPRIKAVDCGDSGSSLLQTCVMCEVALRAKPISERNHREWRFKTFHVISARLNSRAPTCNDYRQSIK